MAERALKQTHPLIIITVIVGLSLVVAAILFGILSSTGIVKSDVAEFGGAAAGFFATLWFLKRWHTSMAHDKTRALEADKRSLEQTLQQLSVPRFTVPPSFTPFVDVEHWMALGYPTAWKQQPLMLQMRAFREDSLIARSGDEYLATFSIAVSTPGQQTYSVKEIAMMAGDLNLTEEELEEEIGIEISETTYSLQVPLETLLNLLGAKGDDRASQIYELNYKQVQQLFGEENVRRDTEVVDGRESLLLEVTHAREERESLVQFMTTIYVPETDLIFTFGFTDNESDRTSIDLLHKQVLATVKLWRPGAVSNSG